MNRDRLQLMADMLDEVDAGTWTPNRELGPTPPTVFDLEDWYKIADCGYAACAIGHAEFDPRFNALGLAPGKYGVPAFDGHSGYPWARIEKFFDIHEATTHWLFDINYYGETRNGPSPAKVRQRVLDLLERGEDYVLSQEPC